ncbi:MULTISPECIES: DUF3310 domain-containing protein [Bacillati]|uniref:DUF3310 domain-containing protein n=1 Tax=Bacillati TaxID=1783272 RepID=UPI00024E143C|nr:DUF3310 domain-containing protein [Staphylococcus epidermidis]EHR86772.1 PF11753 family protein [Staphylococcus epidermidis VCU118]MDU4845940.1 DUF3310 domain-containing protein [Streptococcus mitis]DAK09334.1 MAG TPA: nucelotide kinase [Caudoviricetes sp.]AXE41961.1 DUF3310 domain-containing protein [Staphylococcus epidermidis]MBC2970409.1 DUF3310 domain-containing protein [Staphylococcus epidermidis]
MIYFIDQVTINYKSSLAYYIGNVIKYVSRATLKNSVEDLKKTKWYLERAIDKRK